RDEATALPALLHSIPKGVDVIVVDDHSADGTARVAAAAGASVVTAPELGEVVNGKAAACAAGAAEAISRGATTLVFLDADCVLHRDGLAAIVAEHAEGGGLLSVQ